VPLRPNPLQRRLSPTLAAIVLALLAAVIAGGVAVPEADAAKPCYRQLINDWYDGRIDKSYPIACYREAIKKLPPDVKTYSSAQEDFERALAAAIRQNGGQAPTVVPPSDVGRSVDPSEDPGETDTTGSGGGTSTGPGGDEGTPSPEDEKGVIGSLGPDNADSIPVPLLVLAGVAMLLLAAAAAGFIAKRVQERRVPIVPVAPGAGDGPAPPVPPE
jgi:hypothetical protein